MKLHFFYSIILLLSAIPVFAQVQPQQATYSNGNITQSDVIALWHFDGTGKDSSGNKHDAALRGKDSHFVATGKLGGALQIEEKNEKGDVAQGVSVKNTADLNPKGAFTIEMWMSPSEQLAGKASAFLLDKKYFNYVSDKPGANEGYYLRLRKADKDKFRLQAGLGFGKDSVFINSNPQVFEANKWYHVAFTYDGKGLATFYVDGNRIGQELLEGRGGVATSKYPITIGDRHGSVRKRFYGKIDEVRLLNKAMRYVSGKVLLETTGSRTTYYRMEKDAKMRVRIINDTPEPLSEAQLQVQAKDTFSETISVPALASGKSTFVTIPLNTNLRPDVYEMTATLKVGEKVTESIASSFTIVPRPLPNQMPIIMWNGGGNDYKKFADIGYNTIRVNISVNHDELWNRENTVSLTPVKNSAESHKTFDEMMAAQVNGYIYLSPGTWMQSHRPQYNRTDKVGEKLKNVNGLYPEVQKYFYDVGKSVSREYDDVPNWSSAIIDTEIRDHNAPSYSKIDKDTYHKFSGQDIPTEISSTRGVDYRSLPNFPKNRVIRDDNPILTYYKWFWKEGDGWNNLHSQVHNGLKSTGNKNIFTWFDPATRAPSIWGSGGNVDYINQWTYTYPNPLNNDLSANQQFAMAAGNPGQKVMNMIQIIWYRSKTTQKSPKGQETEWEKASPDAAYISIAPDHLSEATWMELSYPVSAIANHGWGSLGEKLGDKSGKYVTTNTNARKRMTEILQNVVKPLAPTLLQVPDYQSDVAFLESFASQMFAGAGTYGWGRGWGADSYMVARYAGLQPQIIYDETIHKNGLDRYKVLFLTDCPVLTESVVDAVKKFQQNGGIVIGDENLTPGVQADILLSKITRDKPDVTKALMIKKAAQLREELERLYQAPLESDNANIITRLRQYGDSQYIFAINDNRTYGDYVGQYKKVMEKGLPSQGQVTLNTLPAGSVYDVINHRQVPTTKIYGKVQFPVNLDAGEGNLFLVTPKPIGKLQVSAPKTVKRGGNIVVKVLLPDNAGKTLQAVVPISVTIRDAKGQIAEKSGYYGAANGALNINLDIAPNDAMGEWKVEVKEALTGQTQMVSFMVS